MILYFDPFAGISGDMTVGALIDAGLDLDYLRQELKKIPLSDYEISARKVSRCDIAATKFDVRIKESHTHRHFSTIKGLIEASQLSNWVKKNAIDVFTRLGEREAKVHNKTLDEVHFHEVGAVDAIVDVIGSLIGFEKLNVTEFVSGPVNLGRGFVNTEQGTFPVPGPATAELLKEIPTYSSGVEGELTTPTGAAILSTLVTQHGPQPLMAVKEIGYGAGSRNYDRFPNVLRILVGERTSPPEELERETVTLIEANIDDMNPQFYGYFFDKVFEVGALDAYLTPTQMKKNRPGMLLTVLCPNDLVNRMVEFIFTHTTTIGVRYARRERQTMDRFYVPVQTEHGEIRIKVCKFGGKVLNFSPEFEDCRKIADRYGLSLKDVHSLAIKKFMEMEHGKNIDG